MKKEYQSDEGLKELMRKIRGGNEKIGAGIQSSMIGRDLKVSSLLSPLFFLRLKLTFLPVSSLIQDYPELIEGSSRSSARRVSFFVPSRR